MIIREKIKTIDNKIEQNEAQYDEDRQTAKISAFLSGKNVLPEKDLLRRAVPLKNLNVQHKLKN